MKTVSFPVDKVQMTIIRTIPALSRIFTWVAYYLLIMWTPALSATTYFVSTLGNDQNLGTSPLAPWKSIARVNNAYLVAGDEVLLNRGETWRETLSPNTSGSPTSRIIVAAYGIGANPIVTGGNKVINWAPGAAGSGELCSDLPVRPNVVFLGSVRGIKQPQPMHLGEWSYNDGSLCMFGTLNDLLSVEVAQRDYGLLLGQNGGGSFFTVTGIDFHIANEDGVHIVNTSSDTISNGVISGAYQFGVFAIGVDGKFVDHLLIDGNLIQQNGSSGIEISAGHYAVTTRGNTLLQNAFDDQNSGNFIFMAAIYLYSPISIPTYDLVEFNTVIGNGVAGGSESQGAAIWMDTLGQSTMRYNIAFGNASHGLYFEKTNGSAMYNNLSYSNGAASNSANISCYGDYGVGAANNQISNNAAWDSQGIGLKLGAYQGGGFTTFNNNTVDHNIVVNSLGVDVFFDTGANGAGSSNSNSYVANSFGPSSPGWIYWAPTSVSTYAQLDSLYTRTMNNNESAVTSSQIEQEVCYSAPPLESRVDVQRFASWSSVCSQVVKSFFQGKEKPGPAKIALGFYSAPQAKPIH